MIHKRTTRQASVGSLACKVTVWTNLPWDGSMSRRWTSIIVNKITRLGLVVSTVSRQTGWTEQLWGGITLRRWTSMRARPSRLTTRQGLLVMETGMMLLVQLGLIMSKLNLTFLLEMPQI